MLSHSLWLSKPWMEAIINEAVHLSALCTPLVSSMLLSPLLICPRHTVRLEPVQCKATGARTVKLHRKTVGNCVRVTRSKYLLEYMLVVQRGWKGLFLLCPLIPSPKMYYLQDWMHWWLIDSFWHPKSTRLHLPRTVWHRISLNPLSLAKILNPSSILFFLFLSIYGFWKAFLYIVKPKAHSFAPKSNNNFGKDC